MNAGSFEVIDLGKKLHRAAAIRWVAAAFAIPTAVAVSLLVRDAVRVIDGVNEAALQKEQAAVHRAIGMLGVRHVDALEAHARSDTVFRATDTQLDPAWLREAMTAASQSGPGFKDIAVVGPRGDIKFLYSNRGDPAADAAAAVLPAAAAALEHARARYAAAYAKSGTAGGRLSAGSLSVTDLAVVDGQPSLVTVTPIVPASGDIAWAVEPMMLAGIQPLLGPQLATLQSLAHVEGLMHVGARYAGRPGRHAFAIRNLNGQTVTRLSWIFTPPGYAVVSAASPALALSAAFILLMVAYCAALVHRLTRELAIREQAAVYAARHDSATGLANRGWFMNVFSDVLSSEDHAGGSFAVVLIDCDHFKHTNDTFGHPAGDAVLRAVADRLRSLDDRLMIFSRLGGDEFAAVTMPLACSEDASALLEVIERTLSCPVAFDGMAIDLGVSIGAAVFDAPSALSIDDWLARADKALYRAKRDGRGCARVYDPALDHGESGTSAHLRLSDGRPPALPGSVLGKAA